METILLQAQASQGGSGWTSIIMMAAVILIFWLFMIRPQQKRQKEIRKAREAMQPGDKVVTSGGIHGKIKEVGEQTMLIEVAEGVRIRIDKSAIFASAGDAQQQQK